MTVNKTCKHAHANDFLFPGVQKHLNRNNELCSSETLWLQRLVFFPGPIIYGDKLQFRFISPRNKKVQRRIVMLHDFFRTKVTPPASNMLSMVSLIDACRRERSIVTDTWWSNILSTLRRISFENHQYCVTFFGDKSISVELRHVERNHLSKNQFFPPKSYANQTSDPLAITDL